MVITELYVRNFGKLSERHFYLRDGVQVISGENEFGKTTLHAFIRAMLFGLERGRGRAAAKDDFTRYEPWDDPAHYAGTMRFICGGRHFRLERNFARGTKGASLVCEDDGEELSIGDGDLNMLLGGMSAGLFDSTVSIGQLRARPGEELSDALKNRAVNYYETGGGEFDLSAAMQRLKDRKKEVVKELRLEEETCAAQRRSLEQHCGYLEQDMCRLRAEEEEKKIQLARAREVSSAAQEQMENRARTEQRTQTDKARKNDVQAPARGGAGLFVSSAVCLLVGLAMAGINLAGVWGAAFMPSALSFPVFAGAALAGAAGVLMLVIAAVKRRRSRRTPGRMGDGDSVLDGDHGERVPGRGHEDEDRDQERQERAQKRARESVRERVRETETVQRRLEWELGRIRSEYREKSIRCGNVREELLETPKSERILRLEQRRRALELAEESLEKAAQKTGGRVASAVDKRASEIFSAITDGEYIRLYTDSEKGIIVWDGFRNIPAGRLSRGTIEQIWFSLRMAAADILLEEPLPVILDDVFAFYDDKRLESVLKWLSREKKQVIIFTCHSREGETLGKIEAGI